MYVHHTTQVPTPHTDTSSIITSQPPNLKGKGMANEERKRSNLLGTVELGKDINISTQFEEEEEEDESSSVSIIHSILTAQINIYHIRETTLLLHT